MQFSRIEGFGRFASRRHDTSSSEPSLNNAKLEHIKSSDRRYSSTHVRAEEIFNIKTFGNPPQTPGQAIPRIIYDPPGPDLQAQSISSHVKLRCRELEFSVQQKRADTGCATGRCRCPNPSSRGSRSDKRHRPGDFVGGVAIVWPQGHHSELLRLFFAQIGDI